MSGQLEMTSVPDSAQDYIQLSTVKLYSVFASTRSNLRLRAVSHGLFRSGSRFNGHCARKSVDFELVNSRLGHRLGHKLLQNQQ